MTAYLIQTSLHPLVINNILPRVIADIQHTTALSGKQTACYENNIHR